MARVWRVLSLDGGGVRGIIPATILAAIEKRTGKPIAEMFDLIAGTSTGGLITLGLTKPNSHGAPEFSARQLCRLYEDKIPHIFRNPQNWWGNLVTPKYRSHAFKDVLKEKFGDYRLRQATTNVLVACYDIEHRQPYIFKSRIAKRRRDFDLGMKDVALATCASPTLFCPVRIPKTQQGRQVTLVDGGVFANNPAALALAEIKELHHKEGDSCFMLSIGTGRSPRPLTDEFVSLWGYVHWSRPMLELVMESISESVHDTMKHLMAPVDGSEKMYHRIQVPLPEHMNMEIDDATSKNLHELSQLAIDYCKSAEGGALIAQICDRLLDLLDQTGGGSSESMPIAI